MRMRFIGIAALVAALALAASKPASAQGLASLAAANVTSTSAQKTPGCWGCGSMFGLQVCSGGQVPGYYNCTSTVMDTCRLSSPGCGAGASLPVDIDGAAQYVSKGSLLGIPVAYREGQLAVKRNCEGVVVARTQSPDDISSVRMRTGTLSL